MTATAIFVPQAWMDDNAVDVDPEGETTFDITPEVESMGKERALAIKDNTDASDVFQYAAHAPKWIKHWSGPFYIRMAESVAEHFQA